VFEATSHGTFAGFASTTAPATLPPKAEPSRLRCRMRAEQNSDRRRSLPDEGLGEKLISGAPGSLASRQAGSSAQTNTATGNTSHEQIWRSGIFQ